MTFVRGLLCSTGCELVFLPDRIIPPKPPKTPTVGMLVETRVVADANRNNVGEERRITDATQR